MCDSCGKALYVYNEMNGTLQDISVPGYFAVLAARVSVPLARNLVK